MKKLLITLMISCFLLGGYTAAYASDDVITLDQAKDLAKNYIRTMKDYDINKKTAGIKLDKLKDQYDQAYDDYIDYVFNQYSALSNEYNQLEQKADKTADDLARMDELQSQMNSMQDTFQSRYDSVQSMQDQLRDAQQNYDDLVADQANYVKQLDYQVEELYTSILCQEQNLGVLQKDYTIKQQMLKNEETRLKLGGSTRAKVDQLAQDVENADKSIVSAQSSLIKSKGQLNDMMGRDYFDGLRLVPFEVEEGGALPEYNDLLSKFTGKYNDLLRSRRDINQKKSDLLDSYVQDTDYESELLDLEIRGAELQLQDKMVSADETINNLLTTTKEKRADYQTALINYNTAKRDYDWNLVRLDKGQISMMDLWQSEKSYLDAKAKLMSAGYARYLAERALGLAEEGILIT
ncbi:MAG: TolC family protein [Bacillota bacterium]